VAGLVFEAENDLRDLTVGRRQDQAFSGLRRKIVGKRKLPRRRGKVCAYRLPGRLGCKNDGDRRCGRRGLEY
jgi:hypothetical protein